VEIRPGSASDVEPAIAVWRGAGAERRAGEPIPAAVEQRMRDYTATLGAFLVVADDCGTIIGMALGMPARADDGVGPPISGLCHVSAVFVSPQYWGHGIGGSLMASLLSQADTRGYDAAQLWTHADNERARHLYERLGFHRSGREQYDDRDELIIHYRCSLLERQTPAQGLRPQVGPAL
jgi:GNAT superfamily N-acetyltransferase